VPWGGGGGGGGGGEGGMEDKITGYPTYIRQLQRGFCTECKHRMKVY
jgi:hypothetical protein